MSKIKLSATRINTFLSCKQKYWYNYIKKLPKVSNTSFQLGIAVHESLEKAGNIHIAKENFTKSDIKLILDKYRDVSIREGIEDQTIHATGLELVKRRIKNFPIGRRILELEKAFGFKGNPDFITEQGVPLIGAIDKLEEIDDDTLLVVDYKTSNMVPTTDQLKTDLQLSLYDLVVSTLYPNYTRIVVSLDMLKHGEIVYSYRTAEERLEFSTYLKSIYDKITEFHEKTNENSVKATLNTFCGWCDYRDYCTKFKDACSSVDTKFTESSSFSNSELLTEWEHVRNMKRIYDQREKEIASILLNKIKRKNMNIVAGDKELYTRQMARTSYDLKTVLGLVPKPELSRIVNINQSGLKKYMDDNPAVKPYILATAETNFTRPFLATRKSKNGIK